MSKYKVQKPIIHVPSFEKHQIAGVYLKSQLEALGLEMPMGMLDGQYYYTDLEGWGKVLYDLVFSSSLYKRDKFDCPLPEGLAFTMGLFFADGTCSLRDSGYKSANWNICNTDKALLEKCVDPLRYEWGFDFKVKTYTSEAQGKKTNYGRRKNGLYRLETAIGKGNGRNPIRGRFAEDFRDMFYIGKDKKVPGCILESSLETKRAFMEGVIAGDGYEAQHTIGVKGKAGLTGLYLLGSDLMWHPRITNEDRRDNFHYLHYTLRDQYDAFILRYLEDRGLVSTQELANEFDLSNSTMSHILNGLEGENFIKSQKPWSQRKNVSLVKSNQPHCENYALKAMNQCAERHGLNTLAMVIGDIPEGRHGFNIFYHGDGFMLWEPNEGFAWSGQPFEIGENGYKPDLILI